MKKIICFLFCLIAIIVPRLCAQNTDSIVISDDIRLIRIQDSVFIHETWDNSEEYGRFSSNGMIIMKMGKAIMIDTPMDNEKTKQLVEYIEDTYSVKFISLIIGHFHDDCLGGLGYIQSKGIESVANLRTVNKCNELGLKIPSISFSDSLIIDLNDEKIICRYFGGGHTYDNITVWIPSKKILFGGCLIRSANTKGLGNIKDAVLNEWNSTVGKIISKHSDVQVVVPGHGNYGGIELLTHTLGLTEKFKN